jgi:FAD/FMN-containing dehydrogenase
MDRLAEYREKCAKLAAEFAEAKASGFPVGLRKSTSNLFRRRASRNKHLIDVRRFSRVIRVDRQAMTAEVEGMTTYEDFVRETLPENLLPTVVPQLKTITVGGAATGLGIESSSFRYGLVHETVEEMDVLLGDGRIVTCSPRENVDVFYGFPNSYGTLGYALRLQVKLIPAKPYVHLTHTRFSNPEAYFTHIAEVCTAKSTDYIDGTIFGPQEMYVTRGDFVNEAPYVRDYTYMKIYYRSIRQRAEDWLTASGYIWRWDTDWFWCSKHFYVQRPALRWMAKWALNSRTYQHVMRLAQRLTPEDTATESVIQDVDIPIENAAEFFHFLLSEIGITPIWVCPFQSYDPQRVYGLNPLDRHKLHINFGFWDVVPTRHEKGYYNRKIEEKARKLCGAKGLYSSSFYDEETFWGIYNRKLYLELKSKYDPSGVFPDLYAKCVQRR